MKFSVGDKMLIKKTGEEGIILSLMGKDMAEVLVGNTEFPIYLDEIDHPYLSWFTSKNKEKQIAKKLREQIPLEKLSEKQAKIASGIHLVFIPVFGIKEMDEIVERIKIFIVNQSPYTVELSYSMRSNSMLHFTYKGVIHPFTDLYLHFADWETMLEIPRFEWQLRDTINQDFAEKKDQLKIRSTKLFTHIDELKKNNVASFQYTLLEKFEIRTLQIPTPIPNHIIPKTRTSVNNIQEIPKYELDLHIEKLIDNYVAMSNAEILNWQLKFLAKYLHIAILHRQEKMIIVHGIGKGVLRQEVERILKEHKLVSHIESGWQSGYGFGATIAYFYYK